MNETRMEILRRVERGEISTEEGARLLAELEQGILPSPSKEARLGAEAQAAPPPAAQLSEEEQARVRGWKSWWLLPFLLGLALTLGAATWMYQGWLAAGAGWGFWLSFIPLALGIFLLVVGWQSRDGRWLHVRIHRKGRPAPAFAFSLPIPVGSLRWALRMADRFSSADIKEQQIQEVLSALDQEISPENPLHVWVDGEDGEQVEVWIG